MDEALLDETESIVSQGIQITQCSAFSSAIAAIFSFKAAISASFILMISASIYGQFPKTGV